MKGGPKKMFKKKKIDVKIGTEEEAFWNDIKQKTKQEISSLEKMLKFNKAILEMCQKKCKK
jgi:hypothetical protein